MTTPLSWWRRAILASALNNKGIRRHPRLRPILLVEWLEDRLTPTMYQWIGVPSGNWTSPANWSGGPGGTFPSAATDVAQFLDTPTPLPAAVNVLVNGAIGVAAIDFGSAANVTLAGDGVSGDGLRDGAGLTLSQAGSGPANVTAPVAGSGTLTFTGTGAGGVTLSGNNAGFTGTVIINAGSTLNAASNNALGTSPNLIDNGTLNVVPGTGTAAGLAGTYYNFAGAALTPQAVVGNLATAISTTGQVTAVNVANQGSGYSSIPSVIFPPPTGGGIPATGYAVTTGAGGIASVVVTNPGSGYSSADLVGGTLPVVFSGGGAITPAQATATISQPGAVSSVVLTGYPSAALGPLFGGNGYGTTPPTVTFTGGGGSGAAGVAILNTTGVVSPFFQITNAGAGYTAPPTVTIAQTIGGVVNTSATAVGILRNGGGDTGGDPVIGIQLTNPGQGYSNLSTGGLAVTIAAPSMNGTQASATGFVQLPGSIASVQITSGGSGYTAAPAVSFSLPPGVAGSPGFNGTTGFLSSYAATLGTPLATDSTAYENAANSGGTYFEYGTGVSPQPAQLPLNAAGTAPTNLPPANPHTSEGGVAGSGLPNGFPASVNDDASAGACFMAVYQGSFTVPVQGAYTFGTGSAGGSAMWIDGQLVVDNNNGPQGYTQRTSATPFDAGVTTVPTLSAGAHSIVVEYYSGTGVYGFNVLVTGPAGSSYPDGDPISGIMENGLLSHTGTIATNLSIGSIDPSSTGTINIPDNSATLGAGLPTPPLLGNPNGITVGSNNQGLALGGTSGSAITITGGGNITAVGSGNVSFDDVQPFAGTLVADNTGIVQFGDTSAVSGESLTGIVNNTGSNIVINNAGTFALSANISGPSGLSLNGTGTYKLGGMSTFTGGVTIPSGATVSVQSPGGTGCR